MLEGVSRTFALTIPQLPEALCRVVSNAYLLCRIVDTIEDEPILSGVRKNYFCQQFLRILEDARNAEPFSRQLCASLSSQTLPAEHELIRNVPHVIRITRSFSEPQREALQRCVRTMAKGMRQFQLRSRETWTAKLRGPRSILLFCRRGRGPNADPLVLSSLPGNCQKSRRLDGPGDLLRPGPADDEHP